MKYAWSVVTTLLSSLHVHMNVHTTSANSYWFTHNLRDKSGDIFYIVKEYTWIDQNKQWTDFMKFFYKNL